MSVLDRLLPELPPGEVLEVTIGLHWTAVVVDTAGGRRCGLAATQQTAGHTPERLPTVRDAGRLEGRPALELASWGDSDSLTEVSVALATVNALLPTPAGCIDLSAQDYLARHAAGARVALVGHFPFVDSLRAQVAQLWVLELHPQQGDLPAGAAEEIIPQADLLAITSTTIVNRTLETLLRLRRPEATVLLLGPSTPLSARLFDLGIDVLSGSVVEDVATVTRLVRHGATFRQVKRGGVRLVTLERPAGGARS